MSRPYEKWQKGGKESSTKREWMDKRELGEGGNVGLMRLFMVMTRADGSGGLAVCSDSKTKFRA